MSTTPNLMFPQARIDAMIEAARSFDATKLDSSFREWFPNATRMDAAELAFVARQLEFMRPGLLEVQYPSLKGSSLCPINTQADPGDEQFSVTIVDQVGQVKVSRDMASDTPMVEVSVSQGSIPFYSMRLGYQYSLQEARAAMKARFPLQTRKAMATREQMERKLDDIIFLGETVTGIKGLLNQSGTLTYTTSTGGGGSKTFELKTPDEILADLNGAASKVVTDSKEVEVPDTMILPLTSYEHIAGRRVGDGTTESVLSYFKRTTAHITRIEKTHKSESNTGWTGKRGMCYRNDPTKLEAVVSQPFEQLAPQYDGFMVTTHCHMRTAGVALYLPKSVIYFDEI